MDTINVPISLNARTDNVQVPVLDFYEHSSAVLTIDVSFVCSTFDVAVSYLMWCYDTDPYTSFTIDLSATSSLPLSVYSGQVVYTVTDTKTAKVNTYHYHINLNIVATPPTPCTATYALATPVNAGITDPTIDLSSSTPFTVEITGV